MISRPDSTMSNDLIPLELQEYRLITIKSSLEQQIATYNSLLQGMSGLRIQLHITENAEAVETALIHARTQAATTLGAVKTALGKPYDR